MRRRFSGSNSSSMAGRQLLPVTRRPILGPDAATRLEHGAYPQGELLDLDQKSDVDPA